MAVVPGFALREGMRVVGRLLEPVEPAGYPDAAALHAALVEIVDEVIRARPAQLYGWVADVPVTVGRRGAGPPRG